MVAFVDPRQSKVDIVQAVGRAMRKPRGTTAKTVGYVMVPLFAGIDGDSLEEAIKTEKFEAIADVLNALQDHDEELIDIIREMRQAKGEGKAFDPSRLFEKVEFLGPQVRFDKLVQSIAVEITDRLGVSWDEMYGRLVSFRAREGHCRVPGGHKEDGNNLGQWVGTQRRVKDSLSQERLQRLDKIGFVWDVFTEYWEEGFRYLKLYLERERHCMVPHKHKEDGFNLGAWVSNQRTGKDSLSQERRHRLDELGFVWGGRAEQWEKGFRCLKLYLEREGHCRVPQGHKEDGSPLGSWVATQRNGKDSLSQERLQRLDELGFVWDQFSEQWEEGFRYLKLYLEREGNCRVPTKHKEDGSPLGQWVSHQRRGKDSLSQERLQRLDELGFVWDAFTEQWEEGFRHLKQYLEREGHCRAPKGYKEDGFNLGAWVNNLRRGKDSPSQERLQRLDEIGFIWDPHTEQWEEGFRHLKQYLGREGHCRVPKGYKEDGSPLGQWVSTQRKGKDSLSQERRQRLDEIGFVWDGSAIS
jgi:hypothetical protein